MPPKQDIMKRALPVAVALLVLGPLPGQAVTRSAECAGTVATGQVATCSKQFALVDPNDGPLHVSELDTHGNFHTPFGASGKIRLEWKDGAGELMASLDCIALAVSATTDVARALCTDNVPARSDYTLGPQTLTVTVLQATNCTPCAFHGYLSLRGDGEI